MQSHNTCTHCHICTCTTRPCNPTAYCPCVCTSCVWHVNLTFRRVQAWHACSVQRSCNSWVLSCSSLQRVRHSQRRLRTALLQHTRSRSSRHHHDIRLPSRSRRRCRARCSSGTSLRRSRCCRPDSRHGAAACTHTASHDTSAAERRSTWQLRLASSRTSGAGSCVSSCILMINTELPFHPIHDTPFFCFP